jgi:hypothetical protein
MKNNLKKYTEFINEELTAYPKLSDEELSQRLIGGPDSMIGKNNEEKFLILRYTFWGNIIDMTADLRPRSFSDMCKKNTNPEEEYKEMQNLMDRRGWDIQSIKNLFSAKVDEICGYGIGDLVDGKWTDKFNNILAKLNNSLKNKSNVSTNLSNIEDPFRDPLNQQNGHTDIYLYFTFKQLRLNPDFIGLGGEGWSSFTDKEEIIIRYRYGYHHTKYGQMMLKQMNYSQEEFREKALESLQEIIFDEWHNKFFRFYSETKKDKIDRSSGTTIPLSRFIDSLKLEEYSIIEDDRMIIYTKEIANDINKVFPNFTDEKEICSAFTKFLSDFNLDIDFTGNELIINSKFQEI